MKTAPKRLRLELIAFALLLALANLPLLGGRISEPLLFSPAAFLAGEWWRPLTGPLTHVSLYHLALDAGAFFLLYRGLDRHTTAERLILTLACALGSQLMAWPLLVGRSLGGLSGVAHGLMALSALDMIQAPIRGQRHAGLVTLAVVTGKATFEAATGHVLFEAFHWGDIATPVAICHLGGILGGFGCAAAFGIAHASRKRSQTSIAHAGQWRSNLLKST